MSKLPLRSAPQCSATHITTLINALIAKDVELGPTESSAQATLFIYIL
jgi:hypothetical protein